MPPARAPLFEYFLLLLLATVWGASYTFIKLGVASIPPVTLIASRTVIAGAVLLAIMAAKGVAMPRDGQTWRRFLIQAAINSAIPFTLIAWAEKTVDASLATILNSTSPIFTFLLTLTMTRHEPATLAKLFGVAMGLLGICLVIGVDALGGLGHNVAAQLAIVFATICYAGAAVFGRHFRGLHPLVPAAGSMICGAALLIPFSLILEKPWTLMPSASSIAALLGLALISTAFAFVLYFRLIQTLGSIGVTAQAYLRVPIGVLLGVVFLGESLSVAAAIGLVCIVLGVAAMVRQPKATAKS
ncbi:MAG TPA: EamA family transporter [Xanthobacteraceae bacterium]|nr:EamA family transporter [Xanthobacteraceae bacterium]